MMSWLNLKKLLPSRKFWNLLRSKLSSSKGKNKKPKYISCKTSKKLVWPSSLSIQPKKFKTKPNNIRHRSHKYKSQKPVFVDHLFVKPVFVKKERVAHDVQKGGIFDKSADDMWESMVLASPHTHEIDERAEEFIARIKAEMRHQEILARNRL
ncbi:hypothetical protein CASFOL_035514 [Castilleja foliolosa]|uniref:Uncharacterized protein n=1 Tax=Castilleja foliolosa TaxID=1961234 RepID=A0ABD3BTK5_9LAMI